MTRTSATSRALSCLSTQSTTRAIDFDMEDMEEVSSMSRKKADVWKHFAIESYSDGKTKAVCKYCKYPLSISKNSGTTHLNRHIKHACKMNPHKDMKEMLHVESDGDKVFKFDKEVSRKCL